MKRIDRAIALVFSLVITGCAVAPSNRALDIHVTVPEMVEHCDFLGGVYGESYWPYLNVGLEQAKNNALDEAAFLEATHVVWMHHEATWRPFAAGRAYRCDGHRLNQHRY